MYRFPLKVLLSFSICLCLNNRCLAQFPDDSDPIVSPDRDGTAIPEARSPFGLDDLPESAVPTQPPAVGTRDYAGLGNSVAELELESAELSYKVNPNLEAQLKLIAAYNRLVGQVCLGKVFESQRHDPQENSAQCNELIERALQLYPRTPSALCSRYGMETGVCRDSYKTLEVRSINVLATERDQTNMGVKLPLNSFRLSQVGSERLEEFKTKRSQYRSAPTAELRRDILLLGRYLIQQACKLQNMAFEAYDRTAIKGEESKRGPLGLPRPTPTPHAGLAELAGLPEFRPVLLIPPVCRDIITQVLDFDPKFPDGVCVVSGSYSPNCLTAHKNWRTLDIPKTAATSAVPTPVGGRTNHDLTKF